MSWAWPLLDSLDSSFLVLFRSASAHRRWGLGSSLRKDLQWGKGNKNGRLTTREINTERSALRMTPLFFLSVTRVGLKIAYFGVVVWDMYTQNNVDEDQGLTRSHFFLFILTVGHLRSPGFPVDQISTLNNDCCCLLVWRVISCHARAEHVWLSTVQHFGPGGLARVGPHCR